MSIDQIKSNRSSRVASQSPTNQQFFYPYPFLSRPSHVDIRPFNRPTQSSHPDHPSNFPFPPGMISILGGFRCKCKWTSQLFFFLNEWQGLSFVVIQSILLILLLASSPLHGPNGQASSANHPSERGEDAVVAKVEVVEVKVFLVGPDFVELELAI